MKNLLLIVLLISLASVSFGQKIRFTDSANQWNVLIYSCGGDEGYFVTKKAYYTGDTIIHGLRYLKQHEAGFCQFLNACSDTYIREDSAIGKVFAISPIYDTDTVEYVLYDYSLQVGDTIRNVNCSHRVINIDSVQVNGVWHKTWTFDVAENFFTGPYTIMGYTVIEGIGCINTPMYPYCPIMFEHCWQLTCFYSEGSKPVLNHKVGLIFDNAGSCNFLATNDVQSYSESINVLPNPIDETSKIQFPHTITGGIAIQNTYGQITVQIPLKKQTSYCIGQSITVPGIYYYRIKDENTGEIFTGKFVKQ